LFSSGNPGPSISFAAASTDPSFIAGHASRVGFVISENPMVASAIAWALKLARVSGDGEVLVSESRQEFSSRHAGNLCGTVFLAYDERGANGAVGEYARSISVHGGIVSVEERLDHGMHELFVALLLANMFHSSPLEFAGCYPSFPVRSDGGMRAAGHVDRWDTALMENICRSIAGNWQPRLPSMLGEPGIMSASPSESIHFRIAMDLSFPGTPALERDANEIKACHVELDAQMDACSAIWESACASYGISFSAMPRGDGGEALHMLSVVSHETGASSKMEAYLSGVPLDDLIDSPHTVSTSRMW
jgi:hypothetical protein